MPNSISDKTLSFADRMRAAAGNPRYSAAIRKELSDMADEWDSVTKGYAKRGINVRKMVGTWARLRRRWHEITGEALV